ncbi:unnamed protein product [Parajaminaea phylloscopi]
MNDKQLALPEDRPRQLGYGTDIRRSERVWWELGRNGCETVVDSLETGLEVSHCRRQVSNLPLLLTKSPVYEVIVSLLGSHVLGLRTRRMEVDVQDWEEKEGRIGRAA